MTLVMTYPLVLHMSDSIVGQVGDNIYFIFLIAWYQKAWFSLGISPFFHPGLNYPQGWNLASTDTSLATTLFGLLPNLIAGPTFGYNVAMIVTFVLSGWTMFIWVRRLTGSKSAAIIAGTIYAFLPYRMAHFLIGHLNLSGTAWFPLYFMGLHGLFHDRDLGEWRSILLTSLSLGLIGFTSMYYLYMTLIITLVWVAAYLLMVNRHLLKDRAFWRRIALTSVISFLPVLFSVLPFIGLNSQGGLASRPLSYMSMYSASPTDFFLPSTQHFLLGNWVGSNFDRSLWIEATLYIGIFALCLSVLAFIKRNEMGQTAFLKVAVIVAICAFILALGTDLHWLSQRVEIKVPEFFHGVINRDSVPIPMPSYLLVKYLPFFSKMRAIMRIGFFVLILTSAMAGIGAAWLQRRSGTKRAPIVMVGLLALVLFDFYPRPYTELSKIEARPVDIWLASQPGQGALIQFPFIQNEDQDQVFYTLTHGKPYVGGFFSANQPEQYLRIRPVLESFPNREGAALLRSMGVHWIFFDTQRYEDFALVAEQVQALGYVFVDTIDGQAVFIDPTN